MLHRAAASGSEAYDAERKLQIVLDGATRTLAEHEREPVRGA